MGQVTRRIVILTTAVCLRAQTLDPATLLLSRIRVHAATTLARQPNYTCVETIERQRRTGPAKKLQMQDTLRLEVALVDSKEMFAWPGSKKFEDTDLRKMITTGAFGNGNFAIHARAIFTTGAPTFDHRGLVALQGRAAIRYDFHVSRLMSGYHIRMHDREAVVGYHGSFYVDPDSLDLRRLDVVAEDIPYEIGLTDSTDRVDYGQVKIGADSFLLPVESELSMTDVNGQESRNYVRFSACRQYSGESVLRFDDAPAADAENAGGADRELDLPQDLSLSVALDQEIDLKGAAAGDPIRGRLQGDVKHKGRVLLPKGAAVVGRITRLERNSDYTAFGVTFTELEAPGLHATFNLKFDRAFGSDALTQNRRFTSAPIPQPGECLIMLRPDRVRLSRGILTFWRT